MILVRDQISDIDARAVEVAHISVKFVRILSLSSFYSVFLDRDSGFWAPWFFLCDSKMRIVLGFNIIICEKEFVRCSSFLTYLKVDPWPGSSHLKGEIWPGLLKFYEERAPKFEFDRIKEEVRYLTSTNFSIEVSLGIERRSTWII